MNTPKIIHYATVKGQNENGLDGRVEYGIENGWQPYGFQTIDDRGFYQAMVVYEGSGEYITPEELKAYKPFN